jgi:hypothetical protein
MRAFLVLCSLVIAPHLIDAQPTRRSIIVPDVAAADSDVVSIDAVMRTFYDVISGPKGKPRQWARDKALYVKDVRFHILYERAGTPGLQVVNHQQYVDATDSGFVANGFVERETSRCTRRFGNLAQVWSAYEGWYGEGASRRDAGRGINALQLYWDGKRWWITAVSWDSERATNPLPADPAALCPGSSG